MRYCYYASPVGKLLLAGTTAGLTLISFPAGKMAKQPESHWEHNPASFESCMQQLTEYFAGTRREFDLVYTLQGTEFQQKVLRRVAQIAYGTTVSYSAVAQSINNPKAVRAVGLANAANMLPIIIPCHRVVGKDGALTGFGGGIATKRYLLELEQKWLAE